MSANNKKTPKAAPPPAPVASVVQTHFTTDDGAKAYAHFLATANAIPTERVHFVVGGNAKIARYNITRALKVMAPRAAEIATKSPSTNVGELLELAAIGPALVYASNLVPPTYSPGDIERDLATIAPMRTATMHFLEAAVIVGVVPEERMAVIRPGRGPLDRASDCVAIAGVLRDFAVPLTGKTLFDSAYIDRLATIGTRLLGSITPTGGVKDTPERHPAAIVRDRFWTLTEERYDLLRAMAVLVFGIKHLDENVPPLTSRIGVPKEILAAPVDTPVEPKPQ